MHPSICNKNASEGRREAMSENFWAEREEHQRQVQRERRETEELEGLIYAYGYPHHKEQREEGAKLYDAWSEAGPETRTGYLEYCRKEWARVVDEIVLAHKLAGFRLTPVYKQS